MAILPAFMTKSHDGLYFLKPELTPAPSRTIVLYRLYLSVKQQYTQLEIRFVERGIGPIAESAMTELFI